MSKLKADDVIDERTSAQPQTGCRLERTLRGAGVVVVVCVCRGGRVVTDHIAPEAYTFGWKILVINFTFGGFCGYSSQKSSTKLKTPSSNLKRGHRRERNPMGKIRSEETTVQCRTHDARCLYTMVGSHNCR